MKVVESCGCFPTGRHYPGIAHLLRIRIAGIVEEIDADADWIDELVAFVDTETTGREPEIDRVVEVGVVIGHRGQVLREKSWLINPGIPISEESSAVHGIKDSDVRLCGSFRDVLPEIMAFVGGAIPAAYNAAFDKAFLLAELGRAEGPTTGVPSAKYPPLFRREVEWIDPLVLARELYRDEQSRALGDMAQRLGIELANAHRATDDARAALQVLYAFAKDSRVPRKYGGLMQEQKRLGRTQDEARRFWKR
ncbi:MAG: 3'-5' exonuclease [Polyangiaceae bacterium]